MNVKFKANTFCLTLNFNKCRLPTCRVLFSYLASSSLDYTSCILLDLNFLVHVRHCIQQHFIPLVRIFGNDLLTCWANK